MPQLRKPRVLLDCDGPMADFTGGYLAAFEKVTGRSVDRSEVTKWNISENDFFQEELVKNPNLRKEVRSLTHGPGFCFDLKPIVAAQIAVSWMHDTDVDVYVVTSPWDSPTWTHERYEWLEAHFGIPRGRVVATHAKHLVCGDIFVDDKHSHVREWSRAWPDRIGILFDAHYNRDEKHEHRGSWDEVIKRVQQLT